MTIPLPRENQQRPQAWQVCRTDFSAAIVRLNAVQIGVVARNVATNAALPVTKELFATTKSEMRFCYKIFNFFLCIPTYVQCTLNCSFVFCSCATIKMFLSNKRKRILDTFLTHYFALEKLRLQQK